jgi:hypothetical protein
MGFKFTSLPKSKNFNITTRFYDPQKEAMKEREERIKRELKQNTEDEPAFHYGADIKGSFRKAGKRSNERILYIPIGLIALHYFFLK